MKKANSVTKDQSRAVKLYYIYRELKGHAINLDNIRIGIGGPTFLELEKSWKQKVK